MKLIVIRLCLVVDRRDLVELRLTLVTLLFRLGKLFFAVGYLLFAVGYLLFAVGNFLFLFGNELLGGGVICLALIKLRLGGVILLLTLVKLRLALVILLLTGAYLAAAVLIGDNGCGVVLGGLVAAIVLYLVIALGDEGYRVADIVILQIGPAQDAGYILETGGSGEKAEHRSDHKADADDSQCDSFHLISSFLVNGQAIPRFTCPPYACVRPPRSHPQRWAVHGNGFSLQRLFSL